MYVSQRGLVIPKKLVSPEEIESMKRDLTLIPKKNHVMPVEEKPIAAFRENEQKLYVPRFYGIDRYAVESCPHEIEDRIPEGDPIHVPFVRELRDYQKHIVGVYFDHVKDGSGGAILEVPCGRGKCLGLNTPILMYDGTIKMVQDVCVGDVLMGDDSTPRNVLSLARGRETMYKVCSKKGEHYTVNESHILSLKYSTNMNKHVKKGDILDICVKDYLDLPKSYHGRGGPLVGYRVPIDFKYNHSMVPPINPYLVGYWLGDGSSYGTSISTQEATVLKHIQHVFTTSHPNLYLQYTGSQYDYRINSILKKEKGSNEFRQFLFDYNLIKNKHIPTIYKCNSRKIRLEILAGLLDSDGHLVDNCYTIIQKNETLLDDIVFLARSLGFASTKRKCVKTCTNAKNGPKQGIYYKSCIYGSGLDEIPVQCKRKKASPRKLLRNALNYRIHLECIGEDDYYGFEIDGNRRFVLADFTVTHNTIMALNICSVLQKKTLILVHKEFLMNQWIERISDFVPSARVGKIQGPKFDIENKDIVIGMIQTIYNRSYSPKAFDSFGLTIIDEVHRIGSEEFSKTLFKISTAYMLGISATVERKDGLTNILYMFIGPKIYEEERKESSTVEVRAMFYEHPDESYSTEEFDFRGKIKYSTMVSKISDFPPRQRFIVTLLEDLIKENPSKQIMVLSHKRNLLDYLDESVTKKGFASCGQYVGGMKQSALQATEGRQIVLATYAMAAEALDIKSLNTLVMVSPKTDIIQSVGRILRTECAGKIIVDIVDSHDVFQNQWKRRKTFYRKSSYCIKKIHKSEYTNMTDHSKFVTLYDPTVIKPKKGKKDAEEVSVYPF